MASVSSARAQWTRREFLHDSAIGVAGAVVWLSGVRAATAQRPAPLVVSVRSDTVLREDLLDRAVLREMVEAGVAAVSRKRAAATGWRTLVAPNDVVAIRVSTTVPTLSTHHPLVDEVVRGVLSADVPPQNILIWDRFAGHLARFRYVPPFAEELGLPDVRRGRLVASEGAAEGVETAGYDAEAYYESESDHAPRRGPDGARSLYTNVVTRLATKIIAVPAAKVHPITGISGALSGLAFGSVSNTFRFHPFSADGMPMIADIWMHPALRDKHVLTIVDGLVAAYDTGPGYARERYWKAGTLFFARDPVALDTKLASFLNARRQEETPPLRAVGTQTAYISRAGGLALGAHTESDIEYRELPAIF
jgi:hypothetical protein